VTVSVYIHSLEVPPSHGWLYFSTTLLLHARSARETAEAAEQLGAILGELAHVMSRQAAAG
jgi:hypothetical protein